MSANPLQRPFALWLLLLSIGLMLANHFYGDRSYLQRLNTERTLHRPAAPREQAGPPPPALARRVFVLILDGLRDDAADRLPNISRLIPRGTRRTLRAESPTFTYPNVTTMTTGAPPFYSGVRLNDSRPGVPLDSLFDVADRAGFPSKIVSDWELIAQALDRKNAVRLEQSRIELSLLIERAPVRELSWIYFGDIDTAGHRHGARSKQYAEAAARGDALLGQLADTLDLTQDVLVALSDHGHRDRGGHGGSEPEVEHAFFLVIGAHIRQGLRLPTRPTRDVASTLTALLGTPPPRDNLGTPMLDALDAAPRTLPLILAPALAQRAHSEAALGAKITDADSRLGRMLSAGEPGAVEPALLLLSRWEVQREHQLANALSHRQRQRLAIAAAVLFGLFWLARVVYRKRRLRPRSRDLLPLIVYLFLFFALYFAVGYSLTWSVPRGAVSFTVETAIIGLVAAFGAAMARRLRRPREDRSVEEASAVLLLWAVYIVGAAAAGHDPAWLESSRLSFLLVFLSTIEFYAAAFCGFLALGALTGRAGTALAAPASNYPTNSEER